MLDFPAHASVVGRKGGATMEQTRERKKCTYEGLGYSDGTGLCVMGKCMICEDGKWEEDTSVGKYSATS